MTPMLDLIDGEFAGRLAGVLAHSLWQAPLLALAMWGVLRGVPARAANLRYAVSLAALAATLMAAAATWTLMAPGPEMRTAVGLPNAAIQPAAAFPESADTADSVADGGSHVGRAAVVAERWQTAIVVAWLSGVLLMLVRRGRSLHATLKLAGETTDVPDAIIRLVREFRGRLGVARRVAVVTSRQVLVPGVVGVLWPTLVLPASMIAGLTPQELEAILVHELVHIRRHDFAVNLVQLVIEALFFFNPAVWWISRRIRLEREASVDAATARFTGDQIEYASLLAGVAEKLFADAPAPALVGLADRADGGSLVERVKRLVEPGAAPRVRLPWASLVALLLLAAVAVAALWQGTSAAVTLAQDLMTDHERVEAVQSARRQLGPAADPSADGKGTIRGTIRTEDGGPLPERVWLYANSRSRNLNAMVALGDFQEEFSASVPAGTVLIAASADGYAPVYVGPFRVAPDAVVEGVEIVLPVGFTASIRVTDPQGEPIVGAAIRAALMSAGSSVGRRADESVTDADGIARMPHVTRGDFRLTVKCPGYQPFEKELAFSPDRPLEIELQDVEPFRGRIVSPAGQPVADAKIQSLFESQSTGGMSFGRDYGNLGPVVAETDGDGRFTLDALHSDWRYVLLVDSPEFGLAIMTDVAAGGEQTLAIGPHLALRGEIIGPLDKLERNRKGPYVDFFQQAAFEIDRPHSSPIHQRVPVRIENGVGRFECSRLLPGSIVVRAGKHRAEASVSADEPAAAVEIDLDAPLPEPETRQVVLRFLHDGRPVSPEGTVDVNAFSTGGMDRASPIQKAMPVADGRLTVDVPVPGHLRCEPDGMIGWGFSEVSETVPPGEEPLAIDVPVAPAGAIKGQVTLDGKPSPGPEPLVSVYIRWEEKDGASTRHRSETVEAPLDAERRYVATPVPLDAKCSVKLTHGHNIQVSEPFTLEATNPILRVDLRLPRPVQAVVKVVDPEGRPVPDLPLGLSWEQRGASGNSWEGGLTTDARGLLTIPDVNAEVPQYYVKLNSRHTWQPVTVPLRVDGGTTTLRLVRGESLTVTVLDDATGGPLPGVQVYAMREPLASDPGAPNLFEAEAPTDESGACRFSNLPDAPVNLDLRGINRAVNVAGGEDRIVHPGKADQITLRGSPLSASRPGRISARSN